MALFQKSILDDYLNALDERKVILKFNEFQSIFGNSPKQLNILKAKEEQYQEGFLRELFVQILGYTLYPDTDFDLTTEKKNVKDSKKADGAIIKDNTVIAVIELKSAKTIDLNTIENQAFAYKNNQHNCKYVITSNFRKLRFYIDNAIEYEEFDLFRLSLEDFKKLIICLDKTNLFNNLPEQIKTDSNNEEARITKQLYKDYANFRKALFQDICRKNQEFPPVLVFKKTQKLLDRFLFLFFAEDKHLVSKNWTRKILQEWVELRDRFDQYVPLYDRFKKHFEYLNSGHKSRTHDIFAYNGGLFAHDEFLDKILIDDQLLSDGTLKLSDYDFATEVDVNILGHIFEHSLSEIEELQAFDNEVDPKISKRKKDGVYYTPKYITKFIIENTLGVFCNNKWLELGLHEEDFEYIPLKSKKALLTKKDSLNNLLNQYRDWLLKIKVLDPACGSGAFLNASLEFLIHEHRRLDEVKAKLLGGSLILSDIENSILENNLYGVDLNDEAVEIAKLSLWLRTARSGRKLSSLNQNIKNGNSLISDPNIALDKAFDWQAEFVDVVQNGGFDIVIGNPPYVSANNMSFAERQYFNSSEEFKTLKGKWDLYIPFVEKSLGLLKPKGLLSFIIPYGILNQPFSEAIRKLILENYQLVGIVDLHDIKVFADATVPCCILSVINVAGQNDNVQIYRYLNGGIDTVYDLPIESFRTSQLTMFRTENLNIIEEIKNKIKNVTHGKPLSQLYYLSTGAEIHGKESRNESGELISGHSKFDVLFKDYQPGFKEYIEGSSIPKSKNGRYSIPNRDYYLNFRPDIMRSPKFPQLFESPKLMIRGSSGELGILATYDERQLYTPHKITLVINKSKLPVSHNEFVVPAKDSMSLKYLLAILNSKLMNFYYQSVYGGFIDVYPNYLKSLPIPEVDQQTQGHLTTIVDDILQTNHSIKHIKTNFLELLKSSFSNIELTNKLTDWAGLESKDFIGELKKQKLNCSLTEQSKWLAYFIEKKLEVDTLMEKVQNLVSQIDLLVFKLYNISDEEALLTN